MREHDASAYARASAKHDAPAHATDGRTDGLTQKNLRNDGIFSSATPAGGHGDSSIDGATKTLLEDLGIVQGARAKNIRRGERAPISKVTRRLIYKRDRWSCQICGARPFAATEDRMSGALHLDHIVPWSAGGSDRSDNLRTLCGPCNYKRSNFVTGRGEPENVFHWLPGVTKVPSWHEALIELSSRLVTSEREAIRMADSVQS